MTGSDDPYRRDLGAYLTGALEPDEHAAMDTHVAACRDCQAELAQLAPLPSLIRRAVPDGPDPATSYRPGPAFLDGVLAASAKKRRAQRRTLRAWQAAVAVAAAAAVAVAVVPQARSVPAGSVVALHAAAGSTAQGTALLEARPWGTEIVLRLTGLPPGAQCQAWVSSSAQRSPVGTWGSTANHAALVDIATAVHPSTLALEITTVSGRPLLTYVHPG